MKWQAKIWLILLVGLYFGTRWARIHLSLPDFFRFHFTDLLFVPVQLMGALWLTRLVKRDQTIRIDAVWIVLQVLFVSLLFEWYMPRYGADQAKFTGDWRDVCMYVIGGFGFFFFQRWETKSQKPKLRTS